MSKLKKILTLSLPLGLAISLSGPIGPEAVRAASDSSTVESPAELRLTALDTLMRGDKHTALDLYEESIRLAINQFGSDSTFLGDLYYEAGRLYLELDQFNQAEDYLRQAVKINPKNASARLALARLLDKRAKIQESIGQIREALLVNPSSPVARHKFVQTLCKYGQSPSDKSIATQESYTLAMMQKAAREALLRPPSDSQPSSVPKSMSKSAGPSGSRKSAGEKIPALTVPTMPKNLAPISQEDDKPGGKSESFGLHSPAKTENAATKSDIKPGDHGDARAEGQDAAHFGLSLFPLKGMSQRKEQEDRNKEAQKKAQEAQKKSAESDIVDKIKEQARQREKARAAERVERLERAREVKAARAEARSQKAEQKTARPETKAPKPETKAARAEAKAANLETKAAKPEAAAPTKSGEKQNSARPEQAAAQAQPVRMVPVQPQYMMPQMYPMQMPVFQPTPKPRAGRGFVPPPPPTIPMYGGMMPVPVMPQVIPGQPARPAVAKPKVDKPKPAPKEEPKAEDKPPPMATTGDSDSEFLLDWGEPKAKGKKKTKAK